MPQYKGIFALTLFTLALLNFSALAHPLDNWHWRYPQPQGNSLSDVAYGAGQYVGVGHFGTIISSPDGITWTAQDSGVLANLNAVTFGNGLFIAVGDLGTILTSPDAINWSIARNANLTTLSGATWGNGRYVAVGEHGAIVSSPDGFNWASTASGNYALEDVAVGHGLFVIVGGTYPTNNLYSDGDSIVLTSTDARNWLTQTSSLPSHAYSICFAQGTFVALTGNARDFIGTPSISTSTNAQEWQRLVAGAQFSFYITDVAYGADRFVTVASGPINVYSSDAQAWTTNGYGQPPAALNALTWGPSGFVAVGRYGITARSADGITWADSPPSLPGILWNFTALQYGNGMFVAVTEHVATNQYSVVWKSDDGHSWERSLAPGAPLSSLRFGNGLFVGVQDGSLIASTDGIAWTTRDTGPDRLSSIIYCNGLWVASYCNNYLLTSTDTVSWDPQPFTYGCLQDLQFGNGKYVGLLDDGAVVVSGDFNNWFPSTNSPFQSIAFGQGLFVGVTFAGEIWTSPDGFAWSRRLALPPPDVGFFSVAASAFFDVAFAGGTFVAVGGDVVFGGVYGNKTVRAHIFTSPNGKTWKQRPVYFNDALKHVVYGDGTFVATGYHSVAFLQCDPFPALSVPAGRGNSPSNNRLD
jgi:hypothetical protein